MPKYRRSTKILRRLEPVRPQEVIQDQLSFIQRNKEHNLNSTLDVSDDNPLLTFMKTEVKEELDHNQELDFSGEIDIPLKIEEFEGLECDSIKQEGSPEPNEGSLETSNTDLNMLIEWALNLQYDHSKKCSGRLYPSRDIFDKLKCKIVVLHCTVCKKRMLHALQDWAML